MSTTNNMNMTQISMHVSATNMKRTDGMKRKSFLSKIPAPTVAASPMRRILSHTNKKSRCNLIDEALGIVNSPVRSSNGIVSRRRGSMVQRRGSLLCERRASELLFDNGDRLSELMRNCQTDSAEFSSDDESDLED
ncbi:unnamed protein product [Cylindrotheca closterium]|uniref:Uncharacterized protein n=1 Tax=Cylindrotheca closterium TaxID=2856 RepID=A0AAD2FHM9_9STRA|nr:unnamed protein product [Cylindrotheca closterium]